jgi:hypothetical protein
MIDIGTSNGSITADPISGDVTDMEVYEGGESIADIKRFDFPEYKKHYDVDELPSYIDILDLGYWHGEGNDVSQWAYVEPTHEWRQEYRNIDK